jgi:type III secretion system low calcium response chaperone LcrH/SycD
MGEKQSMDTNSLDFDKMDVKKLGDTLQKINFGAGKPAEDTLKLIMEKVVSKGIMPKEALRIGDDTMEAIYTQAYNLYNQGRYKESSYIFRLLMLLDYSTPKYTLGLAACLHRMKDYVNASNLYLLCAAFDQKNPMPHYHAADCYLQMSLPELAILSLKMAIAAAADQPQYAVLKERATLLQNGLEAQLKEETAKAPAPAQAPPKAA